MKRPRLHRILPPLVMSAAAAVPGLSAALIVLHAGGSPTAEFAGTSSPDLASVSTTSRASSGSGASSNSAAAGTKTSTSERQAKSKESGPAAAKPTAAPTSAPPRTVRIVPTATSAPSTVQSAPLQSQSSSTNYVSGATGR